MRTSWAIVAALCWGLAGCGGDKEAGESDGPSSPSSPTDPPTPPTTTPVDADRDGFTEDVDCRDDLDTFFPGAPERCDGNDNDCDGAIDGVGAASIREVVFGTIDEAVAAALDGDTISICKGTHVVDPLALDAGEYTLKGLDQDTVVLQSRTGAAVLEVGNTARVYVEDLTITGASEVADAAVIARGAALLDLRNVSVIDNATTGLLVDGAGANLTAWTNIVVSGNSTAGNGGGLHLRGLFDASSFALFVRNNEAADGGGIYVDADPASTLRFGGVVEDNVASRGGGVFLRGGGVLAATDIEQNTANIGGGLALGASANVEDCRVIGNTAVHGGGVAVLGEPGPAPILSESYVADNSADYGGGLHVAAGAAVVVTSSPYYYTGECLEGNSSISGNTASVAGGGALLEPGATLLVDNTSFGDNSPEDVLTTVGGFEIDYCADCSADAGCAPLPY